MTINIPERYPKAAQRWISYATAGGQFDIRPLGVIEHVVVGNGSPYNYFNGLPVGERKFSHLWISKSGLVEQFAPLTYKSWAQGDGNPDYWSVETEGFPTERLTAAQIQSFADFVVWAQIPLQIANAPGQRGIGTHSMGGAAWGGHECPGAIRAAQRYDIINAANSGGIPVAVGPNNEDIAKAVAYLRLSGVAGQYEPGKDPSVGELLHHAAFYSQENNGLLHDLNGLLHDLINAPQASFDAQAVASALAANTAFVGALADALLSRITLVQKSA